MLFFFYSTYSFYMTINWFLEDSVSSADGLLFYSINLHAVSSTDGETGRDAAGPNACEQKQRGL